MERLVVAAGAALVAASEPETQHVCRTEPQRSPQPVPQPTPQLVPASLPQLAVQSVPERVPRSVTQPAPERVPERPPGGPLPFSATAGADPGSRPADHVPATALERILLQHCLDQGDEDPAAAAARSEVVRAGAARSAARGPVYHFSPPPSVAKMRANIDTFVSDFMECIVRTWPQAPVTALSRKARAAGIICSGAQEGAGKRTNVEQKTWSLRISVAMRFANFIGRTVCLPIDGQRPPDEEIDRGVAKFFNCLNLQTHEVINAFLDARREGLAVAGGGKRIMERTVKGYSAALGFLFYDARLVGVTGAKLVSECVGQRSPWQKKGQLEKETEKRDKREDPGDYIDNPMDAEAIRTHKGAAEKEVRKAGQHNTTSADVTPKMLSLLYDALVRRHLTAPAGTTQPTTGAEAATAHESTPATPVVPARSASVIAIVTPADPDASIAGNDANIESLSARQTDFLAHKHPRFLNITLRITKNGTTVTEMFIVRLYSYFAYVSQEEEDSLGSPTVIPCNTEDTNLPQLFKGVLALAASSPVVGNNGAVLSDLPVIPQMSTAGNRHSDLLLRPRTDINERLTRDLRRVGLDLNNGQRAVSLYGFRRGGSQDLLDWSAKFELVMRLGDWKVDSTSFFIYLTNMNARGTLRSTLRSYGQNDVSQTVAQIMAAHNKWAVGVVASLRARVLGQEAPLDAAGVTAFDLGAAAKLCTIFIECVLLLRYGRADAVPDSEEA
ncbi:hypothetical protein I4F81_011795 [Pyropia yezoensis]|uniref:Uncharacterized protein n=1 Tax=Pyropia yezoensis TaxID=2788 RepID=A0ACC3CGI7_PYRYE|nr:hypothetical protein I4F81_011795 [Neopyropia yezoensis]